MTGKLVEEEARDLVLEIAAKSPGHSASTSSIKSQVSNYRTLTAEDLSPSPSRPRESMWQAIIRNACASHKPTSTSIFSLGFADRTSDGIRVTDKGIQHLISIGRYP
jgi:hypothetical protein